ncbi:MAG TPA: hypothetical protein VFP79_04025 [Pseudolabrys sp.]|nr:hypothetical protein [Pseudolabrys sp.]
MPPHHTQTTQLSSLREPYGMRAFFYSCGLLGIAMWLDVAYCNGKFGQAAVQMFTELALGMKLIG